MTRQPKGRISTTAPQILAYLFRSLRPILHIGCPVTTLSYSKGSRGLFVPSRVIGIFTDTTISLGSWLRQFCASPGGEDPLFRSYRVNLPNSLTMNLPSALVYSTRLRVSVCGTGACALEFSGFSREYDYPRCCSPRMDRILSGSPRTVDLPAVLNGYTLQRPFPSGRGGFTAPSPRHTHSQ